MHQLSTEICASSQQLNGKDSRKASRLQNAYQDGHGLGVDMSQKERER